MQDGVDDRGEWRLQFGAVCVTVAGLFGFLCLTAAYAWELEHHFVCKAGNCVEDNRSWVAAHLPAWAALLLAVLGVVLLRSHVPRRAGSA
jgi:hypothetical protein